MACKKAIAVWAIICIFDAAMNRIFKTIALMALLAVAPQASADGNITVMTYNVRNGVGLDGQRDHARIAGVIKSRKPDFVGIQEVDSMTNRANRAYVLGEIADAAGMIPSFAPAIKYDGGLYGIGLLSENRPDSIKSIPLPGREEQRTLIVGYFRDYVIANTHLSLTPEDALESVGIIRELLGEEKNRPVILMGDLNSHPDSPVIKELSRDFTIISPDATSFPANDPNERIDYIMISKSTSFTPGTAEVIPAATASDHCPVLITLTIHN